MAWPTSSFISKEPLLKSRYFDSKKDMGLCQPGTEYLDFWVQTVKLDFGFSACSVHESVQSAQTADVTALCIYQFKCKSLSLYLIQELLLTHLFSGYARPPFCRSFLLALCSSMQDINIKLIDYCVRVWREGVISSRPHVRLGSTCALTSQKPLICGCLSEKEKKKVLKMLILKENPGFI